MLELDPADPLELSFALHKAVSMSGLSLSEISARLKKEYGVTLTPSGVSHAINQGTIRVQRALQILGSNFTYKYASLMVGQIFASSQIMNRCENSVNTSYQSIPPTI